MTASDHRPSRSADRDGSRHAPLDPRTLGRPVHLLPRFARQLGEALSEQFRQHNRRYRAQYQLGEISIKPGSLALNTGRWLVGQGPLGRVACLVERGLVLSLMAHRYGAAESEADATVPETATEERLQALLCRQLLEGGLQAIDNTEAPELQPSQQPRLAAGSWIVRVPVREAGRKLDSEMLLALEPAYIDRLLKRLAEELPARSPRSATDAQPLERRLSLKLEARLLEQTLPLGELLALRPGDLVPVRLKATEVLVDGSRLFTASVAEHQGKLCLTSFADAD
ncbi:MAG TPA: FliM/FliN family flagellar motor C-terminal domain-containing protein [Roseateles sp.]|nr:FliM/FliN family flagellar motor C-terminal domain-containing protein [Roseateles sp.]